MSDPQSPSSWRAPDWHPDFGDAEAECEHLRELAIAVLSKIPRSSVRLMVPEPGLMLLQFTFSDGTTAEVYSVCDAAGDETRRYALFLFPGTDREQESYASSVSQAIRVLQGDRETVGTSS